MTDARKARQAPAFGLERVDRESLVAEAARMSHMILAPAHRPAHPGVEQIEGHRSMHADGRMQSRCGLPRTVANRAYEFADLSRRLERHGVAVARHEIATRRQAGDLHL